MKNGYVTWKPLLLMLGAVIAVSYGLLQTHAIQPCPTEAMVSDIKEDIRAIRLDIRAIREKQR